MTMTWKNRKAWLALGDRLVAVAPGKSRELLTAIRKYVESEERRARTLDQLGHVGKTSRPRRA